MGSVAGRYGSGVPEGEELSGVDAWEAVTISTRAVMTDHDTVAVLAHHVRRLDAGACAALVADLWRARGYETSREGRDVVATGRDGTLRIRVGSWVETADPPDVLVSRRGGRDVREAAAAGVRVVDAEGLAGMLRYAVDREAARELCERHLGAPPGDLRPPTRERLRARLATLRAATAAVDAGDSTLAPASFLGAVLVLLVVGAVAGVALTGNPGSPGTDSDGAVDALSVPESTPVGGVVASSTPGPTTDATDGPTPNASVVPGLTDEGIVDLSALAAAHARSLLGRSYTLWMDTYRPPPDDREGSPVQFDTDVAVAGDRFLIEENVGDDETRRHLRTVYHDDGDWYIANETAGGTVYTRVTPRGGMAPLPALNPDNVALGLVATYLSTPETAVEGRISGNARDGTGSPTLYRLVGRGTPPTMDANEVRNYTAVALVDRDGLVRDLTVRYTVIDGEETYRVREEWTYGYIGETTVDPPAWYVERFADEANGSGTT